MNNLVKNCHSDQKKSLKIHLLEMAKCKIRFKPHSDSGACRTPIPEHVAQ